MAGHKGKWAENLMEAYWASLGKHCTVHRFTDSADVRGLNRGKKVGAYPQPADYLVTHAGHTFLAEVKATENQKRFSLSAIRTVQMAAAKKMITARGDYYFFVCILYGPVYRIPASFVLAYTGSSIAFDTIPQFLWKAQDQ